MADVWSMYGVNALEIWDLPGNVFFGMTYQIDIKRRETRTSS